jgi:hypothetical protein
MSRLKRPHIPLAVRVIVAERQLDAATSFPHENGERNASVFRTFVDRDGWKKRNPLSEQLDMLLRLLFGEQKVNLDHDPALVNRPFNKRTGKYTPDANDPEHLIYRTKAEHDIKTRIRGDGAQHSDLGLARKLKRIAKNRDPKQRKTKIAQPKHFKWPSRPFNRNRPGGKPGIQTTKETNT